MLLSNLAQLLHSQGRLREAELLYREDLDASRQVHGDAHPDTLVAVSNLAQLLSEQGNFGEARPLAREAAALSHTLFGATDLRSLTLRALSDGLDEQMKEGAAAAPPPLAAAARGAEHELARGAIAARRGLSAAWRMGGKLWSEDQLGLAGMVAC